MSVTAEEPRFRVLVNDEEQYGVLPVSVPVPPHWSDAGFAGTRAQCAAHVDERWPDIRPLSLRRALEE